MLDKTYRLGLAKAEPEVIQLLKSRRNNIKRSSKIPFGESGYIEQYDITEKAEENMDQYLNELKSGTSKGLQQGSEFNQTRKEFWKQRVL